MEPTRVCRSCGAEIPHNPDWSRTRYATRLYCDRACQRRERPSIDRDYVVTDGGCWEWQGTIERNGYGRAYDEALPLGRRSDWAHRISYRRHKGEIPERHEIDHLCKNTRCINPNHLEAVTKAEHARRTMRRLGKDEVHLLAAFLRANGLTYAEIAKALGMSGGPAAFNAVKYAIKKGLVNAEGAA